ncbi:MAG: cation transporter [Coriobacteriales bacterium]|nr:cation transporter [Coriobacteriales bacterium]
MRKSFKMQDLDCANCAAKMEREISGIEGVNSVSINFMSQKLVIDADPERFDEIMELAQKACTKFEPDCLILR